MDLTRYELDNGLTVLLKPSAAAPVVACNVWVGVGSADEAPTEAGLAHVHEHMLFKGTSRRALGEIAGEVEAAGGRINAFTSFDQTCYYVVMSSRYFATGLDILADAVQHSSFEADALASELEVIQEEIKRGRDNPARQATLKLFETAYAEHPYRLPVIGTSESVDSFERQDVLAFFNTHYVPDNITLVVVGDFELDEAKRLVDDAFSGFDNGHYTARSRTQEPDQTEFRGWTGAADINQAHLRVGFHIPHATHQDIPALDLLGAVLGYGDSSRLFQTIQRHQQLVSSIDAGAFTPKNAGLFTVSARYQLPDAGRRDGEVYAAIMREVFRFRHIRPSHVDLERARTIIESQEIYGKQTVEGLAMKLGRYHMVTGDPNYEKTYYAALAEVTPDDLRRVAQTYLTPANCTAVLSHPHAHDGPDAAELAAATHTAFDEAEAERVSQLLSVDDHGFARVELPDGPTLIVQEDHSVETFSIRALSLGGLRCETAHNNGINRLLSSLIDKGTSQWSAEEIAHRVESTAGSIQGLAGRNSFGLSMSGLSQFFEPSFELFAGCLLDSTIPEAEFDRQQRLQLERIHSRRDQLGSVNYDQFCAAFFSPHPYGMPTTGRRETVAELSVDQLRQYYDHLMNRQDLVVVVVGDVDASLAEQLAERYLVGEESATSIDADLPEPSRADETCLVVDDLDKEQAHIIAGFDAPALGDDQQYPLEVLYAVLSGQGGRLFYELRDHQSLAYSVGARLVLGLDASAFVVSLATSPEKIDQAVAGIVHEIRRLRDGTVTADEIERAKRYLTGSHDIGLQKNSSRSLTIGLDALYGLGYKRSLDFGERIDAVGIDDIQAVIDRYIDPDQMVVSITKPDSVAVDDDLVRKAVQTG